MYFAPLDQPLTTMSMMDRLVCCVPCELEKVVDW